jgi:hypothetical protein
LQAIKLPLNLTTGTAAFYPIVDDEFLTTSGLPLGPTAPKINATFLSDIMHDKLDRTFQLLSRSSNPPACEAPHDAAYLYGNPGLPYYKCHSGELYYICGAIVREGGHIQDDNDIKFSRYVLDSWTAFAGTGNPVSDAKFLETRGFTNTSEPVRKAGVWAPVGQNGGDKDLKVVSAARKHIVDGFVFVKVRKRFSNVAVSPHNPNVHNEPTVLSQPLNQELVWYLPRMKLFMEALKPRLEDVRTSQLLRYNAQRRLCGVRGEFAYRRACRI